MSEPVAGPGPSSERPTAGPAPEGSPPGSPPDGDLVEPGPGASPAGSSDGDPSDDGNEAEQQILEQAAAVVEGDIVAIAAERDEMRAVAQRLQADFENYKKRVAKQQADSVERAADSLVEKLVPVLEAADLALVHDVGDEARKLAELLIESMEKEGLEVLRPESGSGFDPNEHEAVMHEPGEGGEPVIADVLRTGYRWRGRLLRAAMVKVKD
jgi:molecular chaperone GrpE